MEIASIQCGLFFTFRLFSLIRPGLRPVHLPRRGRLPPAGEHSSGPGLNFQGSPPHPALRGHPLQAGEGPSSVPGCARSTFPGGEGFLRRGYDTGHFLRRGYDTGRFLRRRLQDQPFQGFFQVFLVYAGIIDDQAVQVRGLGIKGAEGLDLQALGEKCLGQGKVR